MDRKTIEINILTNKYELTTYTGTEPFPFVLEEDCKIGVVLNDIWE